MGATVAIVDRDWFGGSCPHVGCVPSKSLLHAADRHASGEDYSWARASARRDYMVNRPAGRRRARRHARTSARSRPPGRSSCAARAGSRARGVVDGDPRGHDPGAAGQERRRRGGLDVQDAADRGPRRRRGPGRTARRRWPASCRGACWSSAAGRPGCELAQVYARFGVPVTIVQSGPRLAPTEHPRSSEALRFALEADGVHVRTGVRALRARAGAGRDGAHVVELDDGSTAEGHVILLAVGREFPLRDLGLEHYGVAVSGPGAYRRDGSLRLADGLWIAGDPAGPELHTHQGHYQGELVVRMALGEAVTPDYRALPRATYTDPEGGIRRPDARPGAGRRRRRLRVLWPPTRPARGATRWRRRPGT